MFAMSVGIAYIFGVKYSMFLVPRTLQSHLLLHIMVLNKPVKVLEPFSYFFMTIL